jgi:DNA polymerase III epsilon subunit-like protein
MVEPEAYKIHGLSDKYLSQFPLLEDIWPDLKGLLSSEITWVAYNAEFVRESFYSSMADVGFQSQNWLCLMQLFANFTVVGQEKPGKYHKLMDACKIAGVPARDPGSAVGNALMAYDILRWIASLDTFSTDGGFQKE